MAGLSAYHDEGRGQLCGPKAKLGAGVGQVQAREGRGLVISESGYGRGVA